jgi:phosphoribosylformylglycinamidine synthase
MTAACEELETPITGGNVSFYNETLGEGIYPTPVVGIVGILDEVSRATRSHFRESGRSIVLLRGSEAGDAADAEAEFGSSEYAKEILGSLWGYPPALELEKEAALQKCIVSLIAERLIDSAHDCSEGGLAVAVAESGFESLIGARVDLSSNGLASEVALFAEDASRIVISCDPANLQRIQEIAVKYGVAADLLGQTVPEHLEIRLDGKVVASAAVSELKQIWDLALPRALHLETPEHLVPETLQKS